MPSTNGQAELVPAAWDQPVNWLEMAPDNMQALVWQVQCQRKLGAESLFPWRIRKVWGGTLCRAGNLPPILPKALQAGAGTLQCDLLLPEQCWTPASSACSAMALV